MQTMLDSGIDIIAFLQSIGTWLAPFMRLVSQLGRPPAYIAIMTAIYWCWDRQIGLRVALALLLSSGVNDTLKLFFHQPRPYWITSSVAALSAENSFGLPSGHAQQSLVVWTAIARYVRKRWFWIASMALVFVIGLSRMYLGVHFPTDVLVGWMTAGVLLWCLREFEQPLTEWLSQRTLGQLVYVAALVSLSMLALTLWARFTWRGWTIPSDWIATALQNSGEAPDPANLEGSVMMSGMLFAMGAGVAWQWRRGGFDAGGLPSQRLVRYLVGIAGVGILYVVLGALIPEEPSLSGYGMAYLRAVLIGLWVSAAAPTLFLRLGLAKQDE